MQSPLHRPSEPWPSFKEKYMNENQETNFLPDASPEVKGLCNTERACSACFSGNGECLNKQEPSGG